MMWFFLWVLWIYLLVRVIGDIFRGRDISGWGKAGWLAFVILLPFLGVFVYLIARGTDMADREIGRPRTMAASRPDRQPRRLARQARRPA